MECHVWKLVRHNHVGQKGDAPTSQGSARPWRCFLLEAQQSASSRPRAPRFHHAGTTWGVGCKLAIQPWEIGEHRPPMGGWARLTHRQPTCSLLPPNPTGCPLCMAPPPHSQLSPSLPLQPHFVDGHLDLRGREALIGESESPWLLPTCPVLAQPVWVAHLTHRPQLCPHTSVPGAARAWQTPTHNTAGPGCRCSLPWSSPHSGGPSFLCFNAAVKVRKSTSRVQC